MVRTIIQLPEDQAVALERAARRRGVSKAALVREALGARQSVVHIWHAGQGKPDDPTVSADLDWALCTPLPLMLTR